MRKLQSKALFDKWCFISVEKNKSTGKYESPEEAYKRIHEERNVLLKESKKIGLTINLFMCHGSYKKVALWLTTAIVRLSAPVQEISQQG